MLAGPCWQGSGPQLTSPVDLFHALSMKVTHCMEACPLATGTWTHDGHGMHVLIVILYIIHENSVGLSSTTNPNLRGNHPTAWWQWDGLDWVMVA